MEDYSVTLSVLRAALWGKEKYPLEIKGDVDWDTVCKELQDHTVAGLTADVLGANKMLDSGLRQEWIMRAARGMMFAQRLMKEQESLKTLFAEAGIPFVVLKGAAAACYYPKPEYRTMGDVDIIVPPEKFERAFQLLVDHGYHYTAYENDRHENFSRNGIAFELHRYFALMDDAEAAKALDALIFEGIGQADNGRIDSYHFPMLPRLANGLVLLAHIDQHMRGGLGLRQIIDWMMFVDQELDDAWWQQEFGRWTRKLKLEKEAIVITRMCQMYLGLREEGINWCAGADESLCNALMDRIMERGNFGRKLDASRQGVAIAGGLSKLTNIPRWLQARGCVNWKALKKYPFLKSFAWLYQLCRYIRLGLKRARAFRQLISDFKEGRKQEDILDQLEIGRRTLR